MSLCRGGAVLDACVETFHVTVRRLLGTLLLHYVLLDSAPCRVKPPSSLDVICCDNSEVFVLYVPVVRIQCCGEGSSYVWGTVGQYH